MIYLPYMHKVPKRHGEVMRDGAVMHVELRRGSQGPNPIQCHFCPEAVYVNVWHSHSRWHRSIERTNELDGHMTDQLLQASPSASLLCLTLLIGVQGLGCPVNVLLRSTSVLDQKGCEIRTTAPATTSLGLGLSCVWVDSLKQWALTADLRYARDSCHARAGRSA